MLINLVNDQELKLLRSWLEVSMAFVFVSILLACFGELAVILCSSIFARVWVTVLDLLWGNSLCPMSQWSTVAIKCAHLCVLVVLQCIVFRVSC